MAKLWEGPVGLVEQKDGSFAIKPRTDGAYTAEAPEAIVEKVISAKVKLSGWSLWLDGDAEFVGKAPKAGEPVAPAQLKKLAAEAEMIELVMVKRPFIQPKLRLTKGKSSWSNGPARKASTRRVL